jgi:hypothetical protein
MQKPRIINPIVYLRSWVSIALIATWSLSVFTGILLWLAPSGRRSGRSLLLLDLTKREWGDLHFWFSVIALIITLIHVTIDWRALCGCMRYLITTQRRTRVCE